MEGVCEASSDSPSCAEIAAPTAPAEYSSVQESHFTPPTNPPDTVPKHPNISNLFEYPDVSFSALSRSFVLDLPNIEITSLDATASGCFILAGCSNGMVVLFDMTSKDRNGTLVGHIRAKGMHTNLIVTVKFSQDCRFGFAGVIKGSMEMLAVDVGQIQVWHDAALQNSDTLTTTKHTRNSIADSSGLRHKTNAAKLVRTYSHLDPKLRGFGAVSCLSPDNNSNYVLVCGRGIKNVHIWTFAPPQASATQPVSDPVWTCLYDVATNGVTIESLGFREKFWNEWGIARRKLEMLSKSSGMGIRVWDLSHLQEEDASLNKIPYEDIPNSSDCKAICETGTLSFGGTYDFSVIRLDAPKWANRESYEVPLRCNEDDNGERRRRLMRQIEQVLATQDGCHALALCTDGGVLYYHGSPTNVESDGASIGDSRVNVDNQSESHLTEAEVSLASQHNARGGQIGHEEMSGATSNSSRGKAKKRFGQLVEFQNLTREVETGPKVMTDNAWCLKRMGRRGVVVLCRACQGVQTEADATAGAILDVSLLSDLAPGEVGDTLLDDDVDWRRWKYYHDGSATFEWDTPKPVIWPESSGDTASESAAKSRMKSASRGRPPTGKPRTKPSSTSTPQDRAGGAANSAGSSTKRPRGGYTTPGNSTPGNPRNVASAAEGGKSRVDHISPHDNLLPPRGPKSATSTPQGGGGRKQSANAIASPAESEVSSEGLSEVSKRLYSSYGREVSRKKCKYGNSPGLSDSEGSDEDQLAPKAHSSAQPIPSVLKVISRPGPPPLIRRIQPSTEVEPRKPRHPVLEAVARVVTRWQSESYVSAVTPSIPPAKGPHTRAHQTVLLAEQQLLYKQYFSETGRRIEAAVSSCVDTASKSNSEYDIIHVCRHVVDTQNKDYRAVVTEVIHRQNMELRSERAKDIMLSLGTAVAISLSAEQSSRWKFFYSDMYEAGNVCVRELHREISCLGTDEKLILL